MTCKYIGVLSPDLMLEIRGKLLVGVLRSIPYLEGKRRNKD